MLVAGATMVPAEVSAGVVRAATVYATSTLTAIGVSPAVAGLIREGLRMFWMTRLIRVAALAVVAGGGMLALGLAGWSGGANAAADPPAAEAKGPAAAAKPVDEQLAELVKQQARLDREGAEVQARKEQLALKVRELCELKEAKELGASLAISVQEDGAGEGKPSYLVSEVVGSKIGQITCRDLAMLKTYLARVLNDPKGPKTLRIYSNHPASHDLVRPVLAACAAAGYKSAVFLESGATFSQKIQLTPSVTVQNGSFPFKKPAAKEIDLTKLADVNPAQKP
jgi:hypothetical protein